MKTGYRVHIRIGDLGSVPTPLLYPTRKAATAAADQHVAELAAAGLACPVEYRIYAIPCDPRGYPIDDNS